MRRFHIGFSDTAVLLLRDAIPIKCGLLLQRRDHALAAQWLFSACVIHKALNLQLGVIAFTHEAETQELERFTVDVEDRKSVV